jgi:hypothetical protein
MQHGLCFDEWGKRPDCDDMDVRIALSALKRLTGGTSESEN